MIDAITIEAIQKHIKGLMREYKASRKAEKESFDDPAELMRRTLETRKLAHTINYLHRMIGEEKRLK